MLGLMIGFIFHFISRFIQWINWQWWYRHIYLRSPHWQFMKWWKKLWFRITHHGALYCEKCLRPNRLVIHHVTYKRLGRERMSDLQVVCFFCHRPGGGRI